ncbi:uncharacterized protein LOC128869607 [Anastrepha ludens]|uniref:uncharacterized protein LOC128869476 n=1 Tax=Anastrepha ludens TaxID=28586 RepID=UPI0023AFE9F2|nr:uncharacterized protein LOC128869476 [Anastrepha ludens]XP_053968001.1 uncharacterized protein LOC128869476 [Anastrepha ludens]XP_053968155.1 uncharacterized protein LOC128869607 [Anastrepha ludens]
MKPYPHSVTNTPEPKKFNYRLSKCRRVVENAFGHLKARFRRIGKGVDNHIKNVNTVISCACVLHNFLIAEKDLILENWRVEMHRDSRRNIQYGTNAVDRSEGESIRNALKEYFSAEASFSAGDDGGENENEADGAAENEEHEGDIGEFGGAGEATESGMPTYINRN